MEITPHIRSMLGRDAWKVAHRRTGRTFRVLCELMERASAGENVIYLAEHGVMADYAMRKANDMVRAFGIDSAVFHGAVRQIAFPGGGRISFETCTEREWSPEQGKAEMPGRFRGIEIERFVRDWM